MMNWVKHTAYSLGYVIVTKRSKQCKNVLTNKLVLMCDRGGEPSGSGSMVCDQHNHRPTENLEGHAYARRLSEDEFRLVEDLTSKTVPPREILSTLKDQYETNLLTLLTIYEAQKKIRKNEKGVKTPMQFLVSVLDIHHYVYEPYTHPVTNELQALFFVHLTSYEIWRAFPHVLIIDATYKTNIYKMPFVQIVGVTSTGNTFCVAFVFISEEKMDNYKWALEKLKLTLNESMHPRVIVTDRELALMKACEIVFPHTNHLLCRWHIGQNIMKNYKQTIRSKYDWNLFQSAWKVLEDSPTWISLSMYINSGECIPLEAIDIFWRTLNLSLAKSLQSDHIRCDTELNHFKEHFNKQSEVGKRSFLRKYFSSLYQDLNNVKGDGNCGFRSVAVGLGRDENMWPLIRQELLQELRYHEHDYTEILTSRGFKFIWDTVNFSGTGFAPIDKWMSMPDTGLVIASFYRRPVVFISMVKNVVLSSTCFPLWSGPHESESTEPIVVARVGGSHFINLLLREGYPIPSTHPQWRTYRIDRASAWEDMYSNRQLAFEEYIRSRR
ncbi:FAR1-related sequence 5-like protein [Tanacetum coccineum]|uniref:FAR1-related sequence 5-like protein n=1 Tax=Tanacetum coccineum TaxID=301880 RepID=A0ABQ4YG32_9ASTR